MGRKKKQNTFASDLLPDFDELDDAPPAEPEQNDESTLNDDTSSTHTAKSKKSKKKKGKKGKKNQGDDLLPDLDELDNDDTSQTPSQLDNEEPALPPTTQKKGKKNKKKGKKGKKAADDFLPDLDELDTEPPAEEATPEPPATTKPKKNKKGKKGKKNATDDLLPDLDELDDEENAETEEPAKKQSKKKKTKEDLIKELGAETADGEPAKKLTKKELKRLKKQKAKQAEKEKNKAKQEQQQASNKKKGKKAKAAEASKPAPAPAAAAKGGKKPKVLNARLAAIKKQQEEKLRREREIQEQIEREEQERLEAERLLQEKREEEKRKREEAKRKEEEEIAEQKRLGIYMTDAQRAKIEKQRQQMVAMLERQGKGHLIDQLMANHDMDSLKDRKKHRVGDWNRKKKKNKGKNKKQQQEKKQTPAKKEEDKQPAQETAPEKTTTKATPSKKGLTTIAEPESEVSKPSKKPTPKKEEKKEEESDEDLDWEEMSLSSDSDKEDEEEKEEEKKETKEAETKQTTEKKPADEEDEDESWEDELSSSSEEEEKQHKAVKMSKYQKSQLKKQREILAKQEEEFSHEGQSFRNPICCVLGHVDTGKTKILDRIRRTNVQTGEAGGITQQIGATYVPAEAIQTQTAKLNESKKVDLKVPGLLIIDTPGHESFTNLRSRGTSLCDIAILVVDVLHGLERQTLESIELLRKRKCPFVVALNKIDTIYGWKSHPNAPSRDTLKKQSKHTLQLFEEKVKETITLFAEQGMNACLYYKNKDFKKYVSLVPTSAITGEGLPDLLMLMCLLTQNMMASKITYKNEFECTVLEVKVVEGHGHTVDVILSNGVLRETDTIVLCGLNGPIVTKIRALLTPKPLKEIRVKGDYVHHKEIRASMGIKIAAQNLEQAVPGTQMLVVRPDDDIEELKEKVMEDFEEVMSRISTTGRGVYVASSTLGSLEALLSFLKDAKIPVAHISIGPVHKRDVTICSSMLEKAPEYAIILAFDVPISRDAQELADKEEIKIFSANIIYHLFDRFTEHQAKVKEEKKQANAKNAIWPCILSQTGDVFHTKDPITIGINIERGELRVGTPCVAINKKGEKVDLGVVTGIQHEKKARQVAKEGEAVAVSFDSGHIQHGRHLTSKDQIVSKLHRGSIEAIKEGFKEELMANNQYFLRVIVEVKKILGLQ